MGDSPRHHLINTLLYYRSTSTSTKDLLEDPHIVQDGERIAPYVLVRIAEF